MNKKFILIISWLNFIDQHYSFIFLLVGVVCFVDYFRSSSDQTESARLKLSSLRFWIFLKQYFANKVKATTDAAVAP